MKRLKYFILSLFMILIGSTTLFAGCDKYRRLSVTLSQSELTVFLSTDPSENIFDLTATVDGLKSGVSNDVDFVITSPQSSIEEYGKRTKDGDSTTIHYLAKSKGIVEIKAITKEGGKFDTCIVKIENPIKDIEFLKPEFALNRGFEKDFIDYIKFVPLIDGQETSQKNIEFSVLELEGDELNNIKINGTKILVSNNSKLESFTLQVKSLDNEEIVKTISVNIIDTINEVHILNKNNESGELEEVEKIDDEYTIKLAQNVGDINWFQKTIQLNGFIRNGEDILDKGIIGADESFTTSLMVYNAKNKKFEKVSLPYNGEFIQVTYKANGEYQIQQLKKGEEILKFVVDYSDYLGEFTTEVNLRVKVIGMPTKINVINNRKIVDKIILFDKVTTMIDLEVKGVGGEDLYDDPIMISLETVTKPNIVIKDKFGAIIDISKPIIPSKVCPIGISHNYKPTEESPNDLKIKFTSVNYDAVTTSIEVQFIRGDIVLNIPNEKRISADSEGAELIIEGLNESFDKKLLKINIADETIIKVDETKLREEGKIFLVPQNKLGNTTLNIEAPNGLISGNCKIFVFEELNDSTTINIFGRTLKVANDLNAEKIETIVLKTRGVYPISFKINNKYDKLTNEMRVSTNIKNIDESTQTKVEIIDNDSTFNIITNEKIGTVRVELTINGYDEFGELLKNIIFVFNLDVRAPLLSAKPNVYNVSIYDKSKIQSSYIHLAEKRIEFSVNPRNVKLTKEDLSWEIMVGSESYKPESIVDENGKRTYTFRVLNINNIIIIETSDDNLKEAKVYADYLFDNELAFDVICKIKQTFPNEDNVEITTVNEDVKVSFIVKQPQPVQNIILNNIKSNNVDIDGNTFVKNYYTFDTRDMEKDENDNFISGNTYVINYSILPKNSTIQDIKVTHNQAKSDLSIVVDNVNKKIIVKVLRYFKGEAEVIISPKDRDGLTLYQMVYIRIANGSVESPFEISNELELIEINNSLNSHYVLTSDINLESISNFTPIGTKNNPFTGSLNGANKIVFEDKVNEVSYSIYNLKISETITNNKIDNYFGLFGFIGETASILNLTLKGVSIDVSENMNEEGYIYIGGIVGFSKGYIYNCSVSDYSYISKLSATELFNHKLPVGISYKSSNANRRAYVGGIAGYITENNLSRNIKNASEIYPEAIIRAKSNFTDNKAFVNINSTNAGNESLSIVGGLVGINLGSTIFNSDNKSTTIVGINTNCKDSVNLESTYGGLVGFNIGGIYNYHVKSFINGSKYTGGIVGINYGQVINNTVEPVIRGLDYTGGLIGYNIYDKNFKNNNSLLPNLIMNGKFDNKFIVTNSNFYNNYLTLSGKDVIVDTTNDYVDEILNLNIDDVNLKAKHYQVQGNKIQFIDNDETNSLFNTAIIGTKNVGGLIGYSSQEASKISDNVNIQLTIYENSVYSYFKVGDKNSVRKISEYSEDDSAVNKYFGDIVSYNQANANVGGLVGYADNINIEKCFAYANLSTKLLNKDIVNVGGIIGKIGNIKNNAILRISNSHSNGILNNFYVGTVGADGKIANITNEIANVGAFVGNSENIINSKLDGNIVKPYKYNGNKLFYNVETSYSLLREIELGNNEITYVDKFNGTSNIVDVEKKENVTELIPGKTELYQVDKTTKYSYDNFNTINSFYIGFKINYFENDDGSINNMGGSDVSHIKAIPFGYDDILKGHYVLRNNDKFYYFSEIYNDIGTTIYGYSNNAFNRVTKETVSNVIETTGTKSATKLVELNPLNVSILENVNISNYSLYKIKETEDNLNENGFGNNSEKLDILGKEINVINSKYNWYLNKYEYTNPSNIEDKYKSYNGFPILLDLENKYKNSNNFYDDKLKFVIELPPMGIGVDFKADYKKSFIYNNNLNKKELVLTYTEIDPKHFNTDGTLKSFNDKTEFYRNSYSRQIKRAVVAENTYLLKDVIDISALPKFIDINNIKYSSNKGLIEFGLNDNGQEIITVKNAGRDKIVIASKFNKDVSCEVDVNIVSKVSGLNLLKNKRTDEQITTIDLVKNDEINFYIDVYSKFSKYLNSKNYTYDLTQKQNLGIRYYFTNMVNDKLSIYHNEDTKTWSYRLNGINDIVCEKVENNKYIYYVDIESNDVSLLGLEAFNDYSTLICTPYIVLNTELGNDKFFIADSDEIESYTNSFVEVQGHGKGTFVLHNELIRPLQVRIVNETFSMRVDKESVEFSAYTKPFINVTLGTDNFIEKDGKYEFNDSLYFRISNNQLSSKEVDSKQQNSLQLSNLNLVLVNKNIDYLNRQVTFKFMLSVVQNEDGLYNLIEKDELFKIDFYIKQNDNNIKLQEIVNVTIKPQPINEISILHYPSSEYEEKINNGVVEFVPKSNEVAYNNIIPGYMGLLKINLSPYYGNVSSVKIESSIINGQSIGFEQLVYFEDDNSFKYQVAYPQAERIPNGIIAGVRSRIDNENKDLYNYDGNLYIRTMLPSNVQSGLIFTITIRVYALMNGEIRETISNTIDLEVVASPTLRVLYKNSNFGIVARGTDNIITLSGENLGDEKVDFDKETKLYIRNGSVEYGVNGKIKINKNEDGTYTLKVSSNIPQGSIIELTAYVERMINNKLYVSTSTLNLKVADFVVETITVENVRNGVFESILNQNKRLKVSLKDVSYNKFIPQINSKLRDFENEISKKLNISTRTNSTWYQRTYNTDGSFSDVNLREGSYKSFIINKDDDNYLYIRNIFKTSSDILVAKVVIDYSFNETDDIVLLDPNEGKLNNNNNIDESYVVESECEFTFNVQRNTNDKTPDPIEKAEEFLNMEAGGNYILLNDITLSNYKPMSTEIESFDGNGHVITIESFNLELEKDNEGKPIGSTEVVNVGLFEKVAKDTILKNITIEVKPSSLHDVKEEANNNNQDLLIDASEYNSINFGFIAAENNGTITNAQVLNDRLANEIRRERDNLLVNAGVLNGNVEYKDVEGRSISIVKTKTKTNENSNVAGLVAINNGFITNSRVENITINGSGYVAGLVVRNNKSISSSYYKGANILNQSGELITTAGTAGLVVFNESSATIEYSYSMARENFGYRFNPNEKDDKANGIIDWTENIFTKDITGLSLIEKDLFTGTYNNKTLNVLDDDGNKVVFNSENDTLYIEAIKALKENSDTMTLRAMNSGINVDTDGAGFVYQNNGRITNSYSNILVNAAHSAGFVFKSGENGLIEDCYSLSSVRIENDAHSPFTGKTINETDKMYNAKPENISYSHYLSVDETIKFNVVDKNKDKAYYIVLKDKFYDEKELAIKLTVNDMYSYNSFQGYAFNPDFEINEDILRSVWFIPARLKKETFKTHEIIQNNFKHSYYSPSRPELVAANLRSMSVRYLINDFETSEKLHYEYVNELIIGESIRNPYLVYDAKTFNDYGTLANNNINKNYMRFISDISFSGDSVNDIKAETYNIDFVGDIDGNGMHINDLKLIAESQIETQKPITHLGLFGKLYEVENDDGTKFNAIVRNLNIKVSSIDGTGVKYVGTLAGEIINASAFNIIVEGDGVYVNGKSAVGGVVGKISGNSELVNIKSNISVSATNKSTTVSNQFNAYTGNDDSLDNISYAGGIVGVVDVISREGDIITAQKNARIRKVDVGGNVTISGDIAGGLFGLVGSKSTVSDAHFIISTDEKDNPRFISKYAAGGIVGELRGKIERSYIEHDKQFDINKEIKTNINKSTHNSTGSSLIRNGLFNGSPLAQSYYIGGFAGISLGGAITNSYSNANVINGISNYAGGMVGLNAGGILKSVYTTGSVYGKHVGGLVGVVANINYIKEGLTDGHSSDCYTNIAKLRDDGFIITNIQEILPKIDVGYLVLNSVVSANIWRTEDLDKINYDNIGSFAGKFIDHINADVNIINTAGVTAREMAENNVFANATVRLNDRQIEIKEIGGINNDAGYLVMETEYPTDAIPEYTNEDGSIIKYSHGRFGVSHKSETNEDYYYSRLKTYGSLRTIEEIFNRKTDGNISSIYESNRKNSGSGNFVGYNSSKNYNLPNIYKGWSSIYWNGIGLNNAGLPIDENILPTLIARPNIQIVKVYDYQDLLLMNTLPSSEFILMNDITVEGSWTPVGTEAAPFTGSLHSDFNSSNQYNSWTIKNVSITINEDAGIGLFGHIAAANIHDFNVNINKLEILKVNDVALNIGGVVGSVDTNQDESTIENITVVGGKEVLEKTENEEITKIGTSYVPFSGTSKFKATHVSTMGGVVGSAKNAKISNLKTYNINFEPFNSETEHTNAGANYSNDGSYNAIGGVVGYYSKIGAGLNTVDNMYAKNIDIYGNKAKYDEALYIGGLIGAAENAYLSNAKIEEFNLHGEFTSDSKINIGGISGQLLGFVFNNDIVNKDQTKLIDVKLNTSEDIYIGSAFGSLNSLGVEYSRSAKVSKDLFYRNDMNPFAKVLDSIYTIDDVSNALITDISQKIIIESSKKAYVGGVIGKNESKLYNVVSYGDMTVYSNNEVNLGGIIGYALNNSVRNAYSNKLILLSSNKNAKTNMTIGGAIGNAENVLMENIVADGKLDLRFNNENTIIGGLIGTSKNISQRASISHNDIVITDDGSSDNSRIIGGFIGLFNQENQLKASNTYITDSYSTGNISITSKSKSIIGGFVGKAIVETNNIEIKDNENSTFIKNCYTISQVITNENNIYYDDRNVGGFIGNYDVNLDSILVNCYFNKELFKIYENSYNKLVTERYIDGKKINRNFGKGLTLDEMLYSVNERKLNEYTKEIAKELDKTIIKNVKGTNVITIENDYKQWRFEANKYPLLNFVFDGYMSETINPKNPEELIDCPIYYNYFDSKDDEYNQKYSIQILLSGSNKLNYVEEGTNKGESFDGLIFNNDQFVSTGNINSIQRNGSNSNPLYINERAINLNSKTTNGDVVTYHYDFDNKSVILDDSTNIQGAYKDKKPLTSSNILFKNMTIEAINTFTISKIDNLSSVYGLNGVAKNILIEDNYGVIKNSNLDFVDSAINYNYGIIENLNGELYIPIPAVNVNSGIIDTVNVKLNNDCANMIYYLLINNNQKTLNRVTLDFVDTVSTTLETINFDMLINAKNSVINMSFDKLYESNESIKVYYAANRSNIIILNEKLSTDCEFIRMNLEEINDFAQICCYSDDIKDKYSPLDSKENLHSIEMFTNGYVKTNAFRYESKDQEVGYDFINDWVVITGLNKDLPILRNTLKDNHYDYDISDIYYWNKNMEVVEPQNNGNTSTYLVSNANQFAYVGNEISNAKNKTINVTINSTVDLINKLWEPIKVSDSVIVNIKCAISDAPDGIYEDISINNISVLANNDNAGLFGTVYGKLNVYNLLINNGFVATVNGHMLSKTNTIVNNIYRDISDPFISDKNYNFASGSIVGFAYNKVNSENVITINRVGNQYVYAIAPTDSSASGLIGYALQGNIGIKDSYVNSAFLKYKKSYGIINNHSNAKLYMSNTYAVNNDFYKDDIDSSRVETKVATKIETTNEIVENNVKFKSNRYNYYVDQREIIYDSSMIYAITMHKLQSNRLLDFDWKSTWTRRQNVNNNLPIILNNINSWINEGQKAISPDDYNLVGNTYKVYTAKGLAHMSYLSDQGESFENKIIDLVSENYDMSEKLWTPIGSESHKFKGKLTSSIGTPIISGLNITGYIPYNSKNITNLNYLGLFGDIENATIENVQLESSHVSGVMNIGLIAGSAKNSIIQNVSTSGSVAGDTNTGGVIGVIRSVNSGKKVMAGVGNATNNATVTGLFNVGGVVGYNDKAIVRSSENKGEISVNNVASSSSNGRIGGVVGYSTGPIYEIKNTAKVFGMTKANNKAKNIGGLVGELDNNADGVQFVNGYNTGSVFGYDDVTTGLLIGHANSLDIHKLSMIFTSKAPLKYINEIAQATSNIYIGNATSTNLYGEIKTKTDYFKYNSLWESSGFDAFDNNKLFNLLSNDYYVETAEDLSYVMHMINRRTYFDYTNENMKYNITIANDITYIKEFNDVSNCYRFSGSVTSDGTTKTLTLSGEVLNNGGLLFNIVENSNIDNLTINISEINTTANKIGGVCGQAFDSKFVSTVVNIEYKIKGMDYVGGITGYANNVNFSNCKVLGSNAYVVGNGSVGGIVGKAIRNSIIIDNLDVAAVSVNVQGDDSVGGIVGYLEDSTVQSIEYNSNSIIAKSNIGGIAGVANGDGNNSISSCKVVTSFKNSDSNSVGGIAGKVTSSVDSHYVIDNDNVDILIQGDYYLGGIVGYNQEGLISNCVVNANGDKSIRGNSYIGGITGLNSSTTENIINNTINVLIVVDYTDNDKGSVNSSTLKGAGFDYSITFDSENGKGAHPHIVKVTNDKIRKGEQNIGDYISANYIAFIAINKAGTTNNISVDSRIRLLDATCRYDLTMTREDASTEKTFVGIGENRVPVSYTVKAYESKYTEIDKSDKITYQGDSLTAKNVKSTRVVGIYNFDLVHWDGFTYESAVKDLINKVDAETFGHAIN